MMLIFITIACFLIAAILKFNSMAATIKECKEIIDEINWLVKIGLEPSDTYCELSDLVRGQHYFILSNNSMALQCVEYVGLSIAMNTARIYHHGDYHTVAKHGSDVREHIFLSSKNKLLMFDEEGFISNDSELNYRSSRSNIWSVKFPIKANINLEKTE